VADNSFGLKIGIEGEKNFKNALKEINQSFKVLGSEMNLVTSQFDKQDKSIQAITARNNLRIATKSQNGMNRCAQSNNTTGYKGVGFMPQNGKYRARIKINGQEFHIGLYATAELAAHAYDRAAVMLHGNFACTNF
jgi:hypothetical protein